MKLAGSGAVLAFCAMAAPQLARAANECGVGAVVTCDPSGNPYTSGIQYSTTGSQTVNLGSGVVVDAARTAPFFDNAPGLSAASTGTGSVTVNGGQSVSIASADDTAVSLYAANGDIAADLDTVIANNGLSNEEAEGVKAYVATKGDINLNLGQVVTHGSGAIAVDAGTGSGAVNITVGTITTSGGADSAAGILTGGTTAAIHAGSISTEGDFSPGILAQAHQTVTIYAGQVTTTGDHSGGVTGFAGGIAGTPDNLVDIHVTGPVRTSGDFSPGVEAFSGEYVLPDAPYYPVPNGARANVVIDGDVSTTGAGSPAVAVYSNWGPASLTVESGLISTTRSPAIDMTGITIAATIGADTHVIGGFNFAQSQGAVITNYGVIEGGVGSGSLIRSDVVGPITLNNYGTIDSVNLQSQSNLLNNAGTLTAGVKTGAGATVIDNTGTLQGAVTTGAGADTLSNGATLAASVDLGDGDNTLSNTGTFTGALTTGAGADTLANGATFAGAAALGGANDTVNNSGTFTGLLDTGAGDDVVNNSGAFHGAVSMGDGADVFNNTGTFVAETAPGVASADSDFGAGADTFNNGGLLSVRPSDTTPGTVTFKGLETFKNKGTISLVNGHPGDRLVLPGSYAGSGAAVLAVDVATSPTLARDTLVVGGAATGHTAIEINPVGAHGLVVGSATIVQAGAGSTSDAFSIAAGSQNAGFIGYQLLFDPASDSYALVGAPNAVVFETVKVEELVSDFARDSADAWSAHMAQARDAHWAGSGWQGVHGWGQLHGAGRGRTGVGTTNDFNISRTYDLSYDANLYGFQGGLDVAAGPWIAGLTAGYGGADQRFRATSDRTQMQGYNVGAYAGVQVGGAFIQVLGRYSDDRIQMGAATIPVIDFAAHTYGGTVEFGYRFGGRGFFIEPVGSIDYQSTIPNDIAALQSTFAFRRFVSSVGKAGVRFGGTVADWRGARITPYAEVTAVHEFRGTGGFVFSSGGYDFGYADDRRGTYGHASAGVDLISMRGVDGYVQADLDFAHGASGGGGRVGVRFAF
ncbi:MAG: autotransporter domain-containing protein [Proteobacteria bacterium]|nr:autotransporter domain-containing protein [Pseudomonadota bacterium]